MSWCLLWVVLTVYNHQLSVSVISREWFRTPKQFSQQSLGKRQKKSLYHEQKRRNERIFFSDVGSWENSVHRADNFFKAVHLILNIFTLRQRLCHAVKMWRSTDILFVWTFASEGGDVIAQFGENYHKNIELAKEGKERVEMTVNWKRAGNFISLLFQVCWFLFILYLYSFFICVPFPSSILIFKKLNTSTIKYNVSSS